MTIDIAALRERLEKGLRLGLPLPLYEHEARTLLDVYEAAERVAERSTPGADGHMRRLRLALHKEPQR